MTLGQFRRLKPRDFTNAAVLDEIEIVIEQRDALLEACKILVEHIDIHPKALTAIGPGNVDIARAAIATAEKTTP